jgi:hypothetical protein
MLDLRSRLEELRTQKGEVPEIFRYVQAKAGIAFFSQPLFMDETVEAWEAMVNDIATTRLEFLDDDGSWDLV